MGYIFCFNVWFGAGFRKLEGAFAPGNTIDGLALDSNTFDPTLLTKIIKWTYIVVMLKLEPLKMDDFTMLLAWG
jgi:hypothetical protein